MAAATSEMKMRQAERSGPRKTIFGVRPNEAYYEEKRQIGTETTSTFPFTGAEKYVGDWNANKKEGFGTQTWTKGHKYEGEWVANKRSGKGTYWVCEGKRLRKQYAGDWYNNKRHGQGVFMSRNGDRYEGEWQNNVRHGMGKMFYASGEGVSEASYNGSWAGGKRAGLGILIMANGDRYEGHWLDDKKEGPGRYFYKSTNKVYEGEWVDDIPKCGEYQDAPVGSFPDDIAAGLSPNANDAYSFEIPPLKLLGSKAVVSEAVANVRHGRASQMEAPGLKVFDPSELEVLKKCFAEFDPNETGFIVCADLFRLLQFSGIDVPEVAVNEVVASLEADAASQLSFAEFVDVAAILTEMAQ